MADDAFEWRKTISRFTYASIFPIECFQCKTELFSYLILCVAKMPFIPPAPSTGRPRLACGPVGLNAEDARTKCLSLPATSLNTTKASADDKCSSVKGRLALNLRHLGRKSQPRAYLPTAKVVAAPGPHVKSRDQWLLSPKVLSGVSRAPARSGEAKSKIPLYRSHIRHDASSVKSGPQVSSSSSSTLPQEEASFTLTLTPEAVQLLQRRSAERKQRPSAKSTGAAAAESGSVRQSPSKRHTHTTPSSRAPIKTDSKEAAALGGVRSIAKVSLLNERHRYDDVEYEEEGDTGVDERVLMKCTEWLRGLENAPVTMGNGTSNGTASLRSF